MVSHISGNVRWWNVLLNELEVRNIIKHQRESLEAVVDPVSRKCCGAFIAGLECALNE